MHRPGQALSILGQALSILGTLKVSLAPKVSYQRVIEAKMQERRRKRLCYFCEEKWHQDHKHLKPNMYVLEGMDRLGSETVESKVDAEQMTELGEGDMQDCAIVASISVQAMVGTPSPKTMESLGR